MLVLRIFLGIAILAGVATTVLTWTLVRPHVQEIVESRDKFSADLNTEKTNHGKTRKDLTETKTKLTATEKSLTETTAAKNAAETKAGELETQAKTLTTQLNTTRDQLTASQQDLAAWKALGIGVDRVKGALAELKTSKDTIGALEEEKKVLVKQNITLERQLDTFLGKAEAEVPLRPGTKGKILVVDPRWDFVVLDIGSAAELKPNGVMLVTREGKLIGKIKITAVQGDKSIANVVPGWKLQDIMEGDLVVY